MAKNGYKVTRSNYTLKEFHKAAPNGAIYERDFMTTENLSGWRGGMFPHGEHGFKLTFNETPSGARKHHYGSYLENECGGTEWTLNCGAIKDNAESEGKIQIKSDNNTLLSYAYYGSCSELIKSSIKDIIKKYPAELYSTTEECEIEGFEPAVGFEDCMYVLNNDFGIDLMSDGSNVEADSNKLRCMALSYREYNVTIGGAPCGCIGWRLVDLVNGVLDPCAQKKNGGCDYYTKLRADLTDDTTRQTISKTVTIIRYFYNGAPYYLTDTPNLSMRPSATEIKNAFREFDDFENLLLNKDSNPIYTAELDFPHETERGIETYRKYFTWPLSGDWNLDIISQRYSDYINDLLTLADFYDGYRTDNLWRMMTHDSIKNMDITFSRADKAEDSEDYNEGASKVQGLLWAYGRLFDELKRSIDNIRATNTVTYNGQNNVPDYFLSDALTLSGWEVSNSTEGLDKDVRIKYEDSGEEYGVVDANIKFLNTLKINSKSILSRKGTKYGVEMILGLFGYHSDNFAAAIGSEGDYSINEYISIAEAKDNSGKTITHTKVYDDYGNENKLSLEIYSQYRDNQETDYPENADIDLTKGLPVSILYYYNEQGELWKTIIPWFKKEEDLDGNPYFQMYGGWGKMAQGKYSETLKYLSVTNTIADLTKISPKTLNESPNGCLCYVSDISDFDTLFSGVTTTEDLKHYFIIYNINNAGILGGEGWNPVICSASADCQEKTYIEYLENIIDEYRGNNPHVGYGNYDDGEGFFDYIRQIFKGSIDGNLFMDNAYDCNTGEIISAITEQGFSITTQVDNKKCWYFYDKARYNLQDTHMQEIEVGTDGYNYVSKNMSYVNGLNGLIDVRGNSGNTDDVNTIYNEPSIMNRKNLAITFKIRNNAEKNFLESAVLPYVMQIIPTTTILEINFINRA